jgi:hypothetical protein
MNKNLAEILADNLDFLKINNIEKAIGLKKTALVRMIARKEIPEKHKEQLENWWNKWHTSINPIAMRIYKLINPFDNQVFYVGKTIGSLESRLKAHVKELEDNAVSKKREIIASIIDRGSYPVIEEIETAECSCASDELSINEKELSWIVYYNNINEITNVEGLLRPYKHKLTNKSKKALQSEPVPEFEESIKNTPQENRDKVDGYLRESTQNRINELLAELKSPPKNPIIGIKTWVAIREKELVELKSQL